MSDTDDLETQVRGVLRDHGKLATPAATIAADADLYAAGMTSHASVNVMLGLEGAFDLEFPDRLLTRASFQSVAAIAAAIREIRGGQ